MYKDILFPPFFKGLVPLDGTYKVSTQSKGFVHAKTALHTSATHPASFVVKSGDQVSAPLGGTGPYVVKDDIEVLILLITPRSKMLSLFELNGCFAFSHCDIALLITPSFLTGLTYPLTSDEHCRPKSNSCL